MADIVYNAFKKNIMNGSIDLDTDTIKVALVTSTYAPDQDLHEDFADVTNEVTCTGYTAHGQALAFKTTAQDNTNNRGVFDAAEITWPTSTITARVLSSASTQGADCISYLICSRKSRPTRSRALVISRFPRKLTRSCASAKTPEKCRAGKRRKRPTSFVYGMPNHHHAASTPSA